ncbi:MAG: T9SS type A sorting domain-containing protein, partial [Candidatus Sabulitectum sp.]|nr:T9SS type A sorting domain-containing protein [Candidatus Sabulitectum sp.]
KFAQFYTPLGNGASFGEAYKAWWDYIISGGFNPSEQYWHLGMVVIGDPTIMPAMHILGIEDDDTPPAPEILFSANPATGAVTVSSSGEFTIHDMTGRQVASGYHSETFTDLQTGIYLVRAEDQGVTATEKLCVFR